MENDHRAGERQFRIDQAHKRRKSSRTRRHVACVIVGAATVGVVGNAAWSATSPTTPSSGVTMKEGTPGSVVPGPSNDRAAVWRDPATDSGDSATVAQVKASVVGLENALHEAQRLPAPAERRKEPDAKTSAALGKAKGHAREKLSSVWRRSQTEIKVAENSAAMEKVWSDPTYTGFSDNKFVVEEWQGVSTDGTTAVATLLGHNEYFRNGTPELALRAAAGAMDAFSAESTWYVDYSEQWQISLVNQDGTWVIDSQSAVRERPIPKPDQAK